MKAGWFLKNQNLPHRRSLGTKWSFNNSLMDVKRCACWILNLEATVLSKDHMSAVTMWARRQPCRDFTWYRDALPLREGELSGGGLFRGKLVAHDRRVASDGKH